MSDEVDQKIEDITELLAMKLEQSMETRPDPSDPVTAHYQHHKFFANWIREVGKYEKQGFRDILNDDETYESDQDDIKEATRDKLAQFADELNH